MTAGQAGIHHRESYQLVLFCLVPHQCHPWFDSREDAAAYRGSTSRSSTFLPMAGTGMVTVSVVREGAFS